MDKSNRVPNPTLNQQKFWELTDDMPDVLVDGWNEARGALGGGKAVRLLQATKDYYERLSRGEALFFST